MVAISLVPVALACLLANPLVFLLLGPERWCARLGRLRPYRRAFPFSIVVCAFATAVYAARYG